MRNFSSCLALRARASAYGAAPYGRWGGTIRGTVSRSVDKFCTPGPKEGPPGPRKGKKSSWSAIAVLTSSTAARHA